MTTVGELDKEIRSCVKCASILARWPEDGPPRLKPVVPRPVLSEPMSAPILLIGQAPGPTEYRTGRPFSGGAASQPRSEFKRVEADALFLFLQNKKLLPLMNRRTSRAMSAAWQARSWQGNCSFLISREIRLFRGLG